MSVPASETEIIRQQVVVKFWPIAVVFFCVFIPVSFFISHDYLAGSCLLGSFIIFLFSMLIYFKTKNINLASNMLAMLGISVLIPWLITGGPAGTGFWWSLVYVVWAFSVTYTRSAIFWLSTHLICSGLLVGLSQKGILKIAYSIPELLNLLFAFVVTFTLVYLFNRVLRYYLQLADKRAELIAINRELALVNKELEQVAYIASHDLQEPLRNITNYVSLLEKRLEKWQTPDTNYILSVITKSADKMKMLIRELLNFSKIGKDTIVIKIACDEILRDVLADMASIIQETQAQIKVHNLPVIIGNPTELKQLVQNLLSNALKFRKENVAPEISIQCEIEENQWKFSVSDNGIGIQKDFLKKIFLIFQRLHSENEYPGTGIGLATCKKIVETNGGKIWANSTPDVGSTFFFTIPK